MNTKQAMACYIVSACCLLIGTFGEDPTPLAIGIIVAWIPAVINTGE